MPPAALPDLPADWAAALTPLLPVGHLAALDGFLCGQIAKGSTLYPPVALRWAALQRTPLAAVRAVILGQDPYHGPGQAHGLAFSVPTGQRQPPSLRNILKELHHDIGVTPPKHGNLERWADQGVLLLNTVLTVEDGQPGSHAKRGWEDVTAAILRAVNARPGHVAFVFWGAAAQRQAGLVDRSRHLVITSAHPSPLAARGGFFGSRPFSQIDTFLRDHAIEPVDWSL